MNIEYNDLEKYIDKTINRKDYHNSCWDQRMKNKLFALLSSFKSIGIKSVNKNFLEKNISAINYIKLINGWNNDTNNCYIISDNCQFDCRNLDNDNKKNLIKTINTDYYPSFDNKNKDKDGNIIFDDFFLNKLGFDLIATFGLIERVMFENNVSEIIL